MPVRQRQPNEIAQQVVPLLLLGIGLVVTNNSVTFIDDEVECINNAMRPVQETLALYFSGNAFQSHPPLFDILLHFWLRWTGGNFDYLRLPSILFFLAGLFLLARASLFFTGPSGAAAVIWTGALWPFEYHFGRIAMWYSCAFFMVSGLTLAYLKYLEGRTFARWMALFLFALGLIWTNYYGWAFLGCLAVDQLLRRGARDSRRAGELLGMAGLLAASFFPVLRSFLATRHDFVNVHGRPVTIAANAAFSVFSLFVSESVAPWFWRFSVPAGLAIVLCIALAVRWMPPSARRLLFYAAALIALLAVLGILNTKRMTLVAPWVLLPIAVAIETAKPRWATYGLAAALLTIGAIGWYGTYARRYYSAPRFIEPWQEVAGEAAAKIDAGATVISDHPSFLFYLTYILRVPKQNGPWRFQGVLLETVRHPQVFYPLDWLSTGQPTRGKIILVRGGAEAGGSESVDEVAQRLDRSCGSISSRLRMRDEGYQWKQRFFPELGEPQWRIEIREYDCDSSNSKQIYQIPPR